VTHITFTCVLLSQHSQSEGCDLRLYNECAGKKVLQPVFFRMSFWQQFKLNQQTFLDLRYDYGQEYVIDILVDWVANESLLWVDQKFKTRSLFYSNGKEIP
jgi:hypothetical protein